MTVFTACMHASGCQSIFARRIQQSPECCVSVCNSVSWCAKVCGCAQSTSLTDGYSFYVH